MTFKALMRIWSDQVPRILRDATAIIAVVILSSSLRTLLPIGEPVVVSPGLSFLAWMVLLGIALAGSFLIHKAKASARIKIASYLLLTIIAVTAAYFASLNRSAVTSRAFFGYLIPLMWLGLLLARNSELFPRQAPVPIGEDKAHPNARETKEDLTRIGRIVRDPASLFALLALLIGTIYSIVIPYGAGFDEERHMVRIYDSQDWAGFR